jgi:hypothetical protein
MTVERGGVLGCDALPEAFPAGPERREKMRLLLDAGFGDDCPHPVIYAARAGGGAELWGNPARRRPARGMSVSRAVSGARSSHILDSGML